MRCINNIFDMLFFSIFINHFIDLVNNSGEPSVERTTTPSQVKKNYLFQQLPIRK